MNKAWFTLTYGIISVGYMLRTLCDIDIGHESHQSRERFTWFASLSELVICSLRK